MSTLCPVCGRALGGGELVAVCSSCHRHLGGVTLGTTAEFVAPTAEMLAAMDPGAPPPTPRGSCSWCGKGQSAVKKILTAGSVGICNECVSLCSDVLTAELGDTWR